MDMEDSVHHGWNGEGDSFWSSRSYPDDVADLLLNYDRVSNEDELDVECDAEDDDIGDTYNSDGDGED